MSTIERVEVTVPVTWKPETRSGTASRKIGGTAAVFGQTADRLGFAERIERGAFAETIRSHDPFLVYSHNDDAILARKSAGTLTLSEGVNGLNFEATIVNTTVGNDVLELVRTGHLTECSFAMSDVEDEWVNGERVITRVGQLHEITVCPLGAYSQTSVEGRSSSAQKSVERFLGVRGTQVRDRSCYGESSKFSVYRDLAVCEQARVEAEARVMSMPNRNLGEFSSEMPSTVHGGLEDARRRLATVQKRDIGTTAMDPFAPATGGDFIGSLFATSARARAVIAVALKQEPLPKGGMLITVPRLTTGATAATHVELAAVSETDPGTTQATGTVKAVSGQVDVASQAFDMSPGGAMDKAISMELGQATGTALDVSVTTAILAASGITSVVYTDAAPTAAKTFAKIVDARQQTHVAAGEAPDLLLLHPRRLAQLDETLTNPLQYRMSIVSSPSLPTNLGVSTTEDRAIIVVTDDVVLLSRPPELRVMFEVLSGNLTVRIQAYQMTALVVRQPVGVTVISGTGMIVPVL